MFWFKKKDQLKDIQKLEDRIKREIPKNVAKENKTIKHAKKAGEELNRLVAENHFTPQIFLAVGGQRFKGKRL